MHEPTLAAVRLRSNDVRKLMPRLASAQKSVAEYAGDEHFWPQLRQFDIQRHFLSEAETKVH
jgi:hypothetical protein